MRHENSKIDNPSCFCALVAHIPLRNGFPKKTRSGNFSCSGNTVPAITSAELGSIRAIQKIFSRSQSKKSFHQPQNHTQHHTHQNASHNREIKSTVFIFNANVARQFSDPSQLVTEKPPDYSRKNQKCAGEEEIFCEGGHYIPYNVSILFNESTII